jgi:hypothetical protein
MAPNQAAYQRARSCFSLGTRSLRIDPFESYCYLLMLNTFLLHIKFRKRKKDTYTAYVSMPIYLHDSTATLLMLQYD